MDDGKQKVGKFNQGEGAKTTLLNILARDQSYACRPSFLLGLGLEFGKCGLYRVLGLLRDFTILRFLLSISM